MGKPNITQALILLLNLGTLLMSLACPYCPYPTPPSTPPNLPPKHLPPKHPPKVPKPPVVKPAPPYVPKPSPPSPPYEPNPPVVKPPYPKPPIVNPPVTPKPPVVSPNPPVIPKPPIVNPPVIPKPPVVPKPPIVPKPPPIETPCPPPPKAQETCPIDTIKLDACVDLLGGLVHIGIGGSTKDTCCPVLEGLADADAALCLCTTIKAKLLNVKILIPIALEVLVECGKTPPSGFQCPA